MNAEKLHSGGTEQYQYRVVYSNGLGDPVEILLGSFTWLEPDAPETLDELGQFIQSSIDIDCHKVLFVYLENTIANPVGGTTKD